MLGIKPKDVPAQTRLKLPEPQAFVEIAVTGGGPRGSVSFVTLTGKTFVVSAIEGLHAGRVGVFSYQNAVGKFRFSAKCTAVKGHQAVFALPQRIETIQVFQAERKRAAVRLQATVPGQWRFAPGGKGTGDFVRGALTDLSRTGASLTVDRDLKPGSHVELKFSVSTSAQPLVLLGEIMRSTKIEASGKTALGLRFNGIKPEEDRAIMEFINKRQAERRSRGLG